MLATARASAAAPSAIAGVPLRITQDIRHWWSSGEQPAAGAAVHAVSSMEAQDECRSPPAALPGTAAIYARRNRGDGSAARLWRESYKGSGKLVGKRA